MLARPPRPAVSSLVFQQRAKRPRILYGVAHRIIVEIDKDVQTIPPIPSDPTRFLGKLRVGIVRGEHPMAPMIPDVREVRRDDVPPGILGSVGNAQSDPMLMQQAIRFLRKPGIMTEFTHEPKGIGPAGRLLRHLQEPTQTVVVGAKRRRKLKENRTEMRPEGGGIVHEGAPGLFDVMEPFDVRDKPAGLHREQEFIRHHGPPSFIGRNFWKMIEGVIDFSRRKFGGVKLQICATGHILGVKGALPTRIGPARCAD